METVTVKEEALTLQKLLDLFI